MNIRFAWHCSAIGTKSKSLFSIDFNLSQSICSPSHLQFERPTAKGCGRELIEIVSTFCFNERKSLDFAVLMTYWASVCECIIYTNREHIIILFQDFHRRCHLEKKIRYKFYVEQMRSSTSAMSPIRFNILSFRRIRNHS